MIQVSKLRSMGVSHDQEMIDVQLLRCLQVKMLMHDTLSLLVQHLLNG